MSAYPDPNKIPYAQPYQQGGQPPQYGQAPPQYESYQPVPPPNQYTAPPPQPGYNAYADQDQVNLKMTDQQPLLSIPKVEGEQFDYGAGKWKDTPFLFLFMAHLVVIIAVIAMYGQRAIDDLGADVDPSEPTDFNLDVGQIVWSLGGAAVAGGLFAAFWLVVIQKCADTIIKISLLANCVFYLIAAGVTWAAGGGIMSMIWILFAVLTGVYYYFVRRRIPFTQAIIKASATSLQTHPGPIAATYVLTLFNAAWLLVWAFAAIAAMNARGMFDDGHETSGVDGVVYFLLLISLYWTGQVLMNIGHVTTAGTVAMWWLVPNAKDPTCGALKRACTTSLGSICFGSLVVAVLQATRAIVRAARNSARRNNNAAAMCVLCIVDCCLGCIERLIEFLNKYAYTQVAIYGKDFITASKDTWKMFKARGFEVLINDDLTGLVLGMGCLMGGIVSMGVGGGLAYMADSTTITFGVLAGISFLIGLVMTALVMSVVDSAVATTYVVWAQCPAELAVNRPEHYQNIREAAEHMHGRSF